jgi:hypothetical protein
MAQNGADSQEPPKKQYTKRIFTRNAVKRDRLHYAAYKTLVDAKFKNPLKKMPVHDVPLYRKALASQEILVKRVPDARMSRYGLQPFSEDLLNSTVLDMKKIYMVEHTMVHFCDRELIDNSNEFFKD